MKPEWFAEILNAIEPDHLFKVSTLESFQTRFSLIPLFFLSGSLAVHQQPPPYLLQMTREA